MRKQRMRLSHLNGSHSFAENEHVNTVQLPVPSLSFLYFSTPKIKQFSPSTVEHLEPQNRLDDREQFLQKRAFT